MLLKQQTHEMRDKRRLKTETIAITKLHEPNKNTCARRPVFIMSPLGISFHALKEGQRGRSKVNRVPEGNQYIEQRNHQPESMHQRKKFMAEQGSSSRIISSLPHFFQPLLPGFHNHFSIPVGFDNKYLKVSEVGEEDAFLRSPGGEIYRVKMGKGREFKDGWKEFVDDHDLHVGDVVVFRLVDAPMVFDVMIFDPNACERPYRRQQLDAKTEDVQEEEEEEEKPLPCAADVPGPETGLHSRSVDNISGTSREEIVKDGPSEAKKPYFVVSIKLDTLKRGRVIVPKSFSKMNGLDAAHTTDAVVLDEEGRSWPIGINYYGNSTRTTYIERGWRVIQKECELKLGDTFNLELVQCGQKLALRMYGLHANPMLEREYRDKARKEERKNVKDVKTEPFRDQDSPAAGFSKMPDSHFMLTITNQFLRGISLRIPDDLARYSGLYGGSRTLILTNEKGGDWLVTVETSSNNITYIASGWTELVKENGLHVGDTLMVDLVEKGMNPAMTFKVVSRNTIVTQKKKKEPLRDEVTDVMPMESRDLPE